MRIMELIGFLIFFLQVADAKVDKCANTIGALPNTRGNCICRRQTCQEHEIYCDRRKREQSCSANATPECGNTNGTEPNPDGNCKCRLNTCTADEKYCDTRKRLDVCGNTKTPQCGNTNGTEPNPDGNCKCRLKTCNANEIYCDTRKSFEVCGNTKTPQCVNIDGTVENTGGNCKCRKRTCKSDEKYCDMRIKQRCSANATPQCANTDGTLANTGGNCKCKKKTCKLHQIYCDESKIKVCSTTKTLSSADEQAPTQSAARVSTTCSLTSGSAQSCHHSDFKKADPLQDDAGFDFDVPPHGPMPKIKVPPIPRNTGAHTLEFVIKLNLTASVRLLHYKGVVDIYVEDGMAIYNSTLSDGTTLMARTSERLTSGWQHLVFVSDWTDVMYKLRIYVDGQLAGSNETISKPKCTTFNSTECSALGELGPSQPTKFTMREFQVFEDVLSNQAVKSEFDAANWTQPLKQELTLSFQPAEEIKSLDNKATLMDELKEMLRRPIFEALKATSDEVSGKSSCALDLRREDIIILDIQWVYAADRRILSVRTGTLRVSTRKLHNLASGVSLVVRYKVLVRQNGVNKLKESMNSDGVFGAEFLEDLEKSLEPFKLEPVSKVVASEVTCIAEDRYFQSARALADRRATLDKNLLLDVSSQHVGDSSQHVETSSQHVEESSQHTETSSQHTETSSQHVENAAEPHCTLLAKATLLEDVCDLIEERIPMPLDAAGMLRTKVSLGPDVLRDLEDVCGTLLNADQNVRGVLLRQDEMRLLLLFRRKAGAQTTPSTTTLLSPLSGL